MKIRGIDVSNNNGLIDWHAVAAAGIEFAIMKCTEGTGFVDSTFTANWATAPKAPGDIARGAYHFADLTDATVEAEHFAATLGDRLHQGDVVVLDIEVGIGDLSAWALTWLEKVTALTGCRPWLYASYYFVLEHLQDKRLADYPLWCADYAPACPPPPKPWNLISAWQSADNGKVPGINGNVDLDTFYGDKATFHKLGKP